MAKIWKTVVKSEGGDVGHTETLYESAFTARGAISKALSKATLDKLSTKLSVECEVEYDDMEQLLETMKK